MGLFSNPKCPQCGRETTFGTAWDGDFYECKPCRRKATKEHEGKKVLEARVLRLEKQLKERVEDE